MSDCGKCTIELVEVDDIRRGGTKLRPRRGTESVCVGGDGCKLGWSPIPGTDAFPLAAAPSEETTE